VKAVEHPLGIGCQVGADPSGFTGVPGVWVAGNVFDVTAGVMQSAASGVTAARRAQRRPDRGRRRVRRPGPVSAVTQRRPAPRNPRPTPSGTGRIGTAAARSSVGGRPNAVPASLVTGLPASTAIDLGCGLGGDAMWLARQGGT